MAIIDSPRVTINGIALTEQTVAPATPSSGKQILYVSASGLTVLDSNGSSKRMVSDTSPNSVTCFQFEGQVTSGNFTNTALNVNTGFPFNFYCLSGGATADGDELTFVRNLQAGTYNYQVWGFKATSRAKLDWYIDGSTFITGQDWYVANPAAASFTASGVVVPTSGSHAIKCKVNGRNASANGWLISLTYFSLTRST